jgi:GntR family transcriptional regulator
MRGVIIEMNEGWTSVVFNNRDPVYLQVVRHFKERIATGRLKAGQVIPSRRELGALLKINPNTAQKAYKEMEEQRLIITEGNSPSRITEEADILRVIRSELIEDAVEAFVVLRSKLRSLALMRSIGLFSLTIVSISIVRKAQHIS